MLKNMSAAVAVSCLAASAMAAPTTVTFQNGVDGYSGTVDTEILNRSGFEDADQSGKEVIYTDAGGDIVQSLMRFENIFGDGPGQIALGSTITSATLTLRVPSDEGSAPGSGALVHRMLIGWDATDSWNSLGSGIQADGTEALATADDSIGHNNSSNAINPGFHDFDVLASLQAWSAGADNHGWALMPFMPNGTGGLGFASSDYDGSDPNALPLLSVTFEPIPEPASLAILAMGGALLARRRR